ncbi:hypothetical protein O3P69_011216 [Scylla paramamosain]|uniref:Uncharacterized protein n=1 Tax=Scylla paramamosain TaxID=85552 RepID=A0AAW0STR7_SCYPA
MTSQRSSTENEDKERRRVYFVAASFSGCIHPPAAPAPADGCWLRALRCQGDNGRMVCGGVGVVVWWYDVDGILEMYGREGGVTPGGDGGGHAVTALYLPGRAGRHLQRVERLQQGRPQRGPRRQARREPRPGRPLGRPQRGELRPPPLEQPQRCPRQELPRPVPPVGPPLVRPLLGFLQRELPRRGRLPLLLVCG